MREILFRGKSANDNEWVKGSLVITTIEPVVGIPFKEYRIENMTIGLFPNGFQSGFNEEVAPETVGQFTGLTDKNGKQIFEGDIIRALVNEVEESSELIDLGIADKIVKVPTGNKIQAFWSVEWKTFSGSVGWRVYGKDRRFNRPFTPNMIFNCQCEVIGNIHDNPELLEG